jgi:hypothetical protein
MKPVTWSHSSLKDFEGCPRRYHEVKVLNNFPFQETEAVKYGKLFHTAAEVYIKDGTPLPPEFAYAKDMLDALVAKHGRKLCEHEMALTRDLQPCDFHDKNRWVRGIADLLIIDDENFTAWVMDYKTGNNKYPDRDQLKLMSLMVFKHVPHIRRINSALLFVLKHDMVKACMDVDEVDAGWWGYRERVAKIEACAASGVWNPKPSGLCRAHCPVITCEYNGKH